MQGPHAEHIVDLPLVSRDLEHLHKDGASDAADYERAKGMHYVGASAHRDQSGKRAVVHEAWIVIADDQRNYPPETIAGTAAAKVQRKKKRTRV